MTTLSTLIFSQKGLSSSFSIEGGLGTSHAPSFICLNYDIHLNDNFYWILSVGAPSLVTGLEEAAKFRNDLQIKEMRLLLQQLVIRLVRKVIFGKL